MKLGADKIKIATSLQEAVDAADIIFTCLGDDMAVSCTIITALEGGDVKGKIFVDCSTVHPTTTKELTERINARGAEFVAMPGMAMS